MTSPIERHLAVEVVKAAEDLISYLKPTMGQDRQGWLLLENLIEQIGWLKGFIHHGAFRCLEAAPQKTAKHGESRGLARAAELLLRYASVVRECHSSELDRFDYLPEIEDAAKTVTEAARQAYCSSASSAGVPRSLSEFVHADETPRTDEVVRLADFDRLARCSRGLERELHVTFEELDEMRVRAIEAEARLGMAS